MRSGPDPKRRPGRPSRPAGPEARRRSGPDRAPEGGASPAPRPSGRDRARPGLRLGARPLGGEPRPARPPSRPGVPHAGFDRRRLADLVGPDDEVVAGRWPVQEAFVAGRPARRLLVVPHRRKALEDLVLHAVRLRIPIVEVEGGILTAVAGFDGHQGIALVVAPRRPADLDEILARALERREAPFLLVLDSLEDPQNVGTLLRSAEAAGVHGVVVPRRRQAPLTPAAVKASAGATEHLLIAPVDDLAGALADLHVRGLRVVAADAAAPLSYREADLRGPLALVVGSEGRGLSAAVRRRCDLFVRIPLHGAVGSLNAAVAGSILLFEARAQRGTAPAGSTDVAAPKGPAATRGSVAAERAGSSATGERPPATEGRPPGGRQPASEAEPPASGPRPLGAPPAAAPSPGAAADALLPGELVGPAGGDEAGSAGETSPSAPSASDAAADPGPAPAATA